MIDEKIKDLLCEGASLQEIAKKVKMSVSGVKWRISRLKKEYKAKNITDLAVKITMLRFSHEFL